MPTRKRQKTIPISMDDVRLIMGREFANLHIYLESTFCVRCSDQANTLLNPTAKVNDLEDILFDGVCSNCGGRVGRYVETGENKEMAARARDLRARLMKM